MYIAYLFSASIILVPEKSIFKIQIVSNVDSNSCYYMFLVLSGNKRTFICMFQQPFYRNRGTCLRVHALSFSW